MLTYILIVDDNPDAREILERIAHSLGYETRTACNGVEALEQINKELPALILLDLMMPEMGGFAVLSHLSKFPDLRQVPVIVFSACDASQLSGALRQRNVAGVLKKGQCTISEMVTTIKGVLEHSTAEPSRQHAVNQIAP
ncbi:MAG: hypothetical protein Kow00124_32060 [Anaerolineae bacterium]